MKNTGAIVFFLVVLMVKCYEANAQSCGTTTCPWVIGGDVLITSSCSGPPMTVRIYDTKGTTVTTADDVLLASASLSTLQYSEALVSLPSNIDLNQIRITGQPSSCSIYPQEYDMSGYTSISSTGISWDVINPAWEFSGVLYKFTPPVASGCDVVTFSLPTHLSNYTRVTSHSNPYSHVSWKISNGSTSFTLDTYGQDGINVTTAQMQSWFGSSFSISKSYTMIATDENLPPHDPVTFRMRSVPPQINFNPVPKYCNPQGRLDVVSSNISPNIPQVNIRFHGLAPDLSNIPISSLASLSIPLSSGTYEIQIENYNPSDPGDNCLTNYSNNNTLIPYPVGPSKTVPDGSYSLNVIKVAQSNVTCNGGSNGAINLNVAGGNGTLNYTWTGPTGGQTTQNISGLPKGTYGVTVKDVNQCSGSLNGIAITEPSALSVPTATITSRSLSNHNGRDISCVGASDGQITFSAPSGGSGNYQYSINGGSSYQLSNVFSDQPVSTYIIKIRDANDFSCTQSGSNIILNNPPAIVPGVVSTSCLGGSNNIAVLSGASGGTGQLNWSIGGSYQSVATSFTGLSPNTYSVTLKDANNCSASAGSITVNQPISASYSSSPASCSTVNDGQISVTGATGGTQSFSYSLDGTNYQTSNIFLGKGSGTYTIYVKDGNGCVYTISNATIGVLPSVSGTITQTSSINCFGQTTAAFNVVASGGAPPYASYSWSNGASGATVSNVGAGTYTVTIKDSKGCLGTKSITINQPSQLSATLTPSDFNEVNIRCKGGSDGSINVTPSGGTSPYSYLWSTGSTSQNLNALTSGIYSVTITDSKSCQITKNISLTEPSSSVSLALQSKSNVTCYGANNGAITVTGSGGVGALSYSIDGTNFQPGNSFTSLSASNYNVIAKDANNCSASISSINISSPTALSISSIIKTDPSCYEASTGSLKITPTGGTSPYTYSIDGTNYVSTSTFNSLASGSYIITVRDANNCNLSSSSQALADPPQITASTSTTSQSCSANTDGTISVSASGGTGALTYSINSTTFQSSPMFTNLIAGTYTITIQDENSCSKTVSAVVGLLPALSGSLTQTAFINCYGQSSAALSLVPTGGISPYTYSWSNGAVTQNLSSLPAGNYSVVITDSKNCNTTKSITVTQPTLLSASLTGSDYNGYGVSCQSSADGFINLTVNGGSSPYTYTWSNEADTKNISALAAGSYTVTVTDSKSCTANQTQLLSAPTVLALTLSKTDITCNGGNDGTITADATGGTGSYLFSIDGGINWQSSTMFNSIVEGSYSIQVQDQNSCATTTSATITQPTAINIAIGTIQYAACGQTDGAVQANVSGGTGVLSYSWRDSSNQAVDNTANLSNVGSGTYTLIVTDQNNCTKTESASVSNPSGPVFSVINQIATTCANSADGQAAISVASGQSPFGVSWSDGEMGNTAIHLTGGNNTVTVIDGNNCLTTQNFTVAAPTAITLSSVQITSPVCPEGTDGSIQVIPTGGSGVYTYQWNSIAGSNAITGVAAGNYNLQITDAVNCTFNQTINLADRPSIAINVVSQVSPTCSNLNDGSLIIQATGGNGSFSYSWNTGATVAQLNSIGSGDYTVTAKDNKNCTQTKTITMTAPAPMSSTLTPTSVGCNGGNDGTITASSSGGTGQYSFSINNGNTWQAQNFFTGLTAGNYTVQTKDQNGCNISYQTNISEPTLLTINTTKIDPTCNQSNGSAQAIAAGGTGNYSYLWTNSANQTQSTTSDLQKVLPDTYTIKVTDANNCSTTSLVVMNSYASAQFTIANIGSTMCNYSKDGSATVQITSAQAPYTIAWSNGESTGTATQLVAGQNSISITDVNGCTVTKTFQVPSPQALTAAIETLINPVCASGRDGSIQVIMTGGTGTLSYIWNGTAGSNAIQNLKAGTYNLIVKDVNNCAFTKSYVITDPTPFTIDLGPDITICPNTTTQIGLTLPNATYSWSGPNGFTSTAGVVNVGGAGTYLLKLTNAIGCQASDDITISVSNNLLKSDFLMVSEASVGDTIVVIDISWPIPDQIEWYLGDSATVLHADNDYALISYNDPGTYTVGVKATMGGCSDEYYQHIIIDEKNNNQGGRVASELTIESFVAYPNPFEGKTNVEILLSQPGNASIKVYSLSTNSLIVSRQFEGEKNYNAELDLNGRETGLYIIVLEAGAKTKSIKVIKL